MTSMATALSEDFGASSSAVHAANVAMGEGETGDNTQHDAEAGSVIVSTEELMVDSPI
jgi:hypothetical protein